MRVAMAAMPASLITLLYILHSSLAPFAFADNGGDSAESVGMTNMPVWSSEMKGILLQEAKERLDRLGTVSDVKGSLQRTFLSPGALRASRMIDTWMQEAGMRTWTDGVGNVHGRLDGTNPTAPALLIGSHMDTVMDAGKYDGLLGVVCAIAAVKAFNKFDGAQHLHRPVEVIAFSDEEGVRFQSTFLGSSAVAGTSPPDILHATDSKGITFGAALDALGLESTPEGLASLKYDPRKVWGYVEAHIEQGPVLEEYGLSLGVVPAIAGQTRLRVVMEGEQGHAGTVPMRMRRDPMAGAAAAVVALEDECTHSSTLSESGERVSLLKQQEEADASGLVCTVGQMELWPGASNVIPGKVTFSVDIRARADSLRQTTVKNLSERVMRICEDRKLKCSVELKHQAAAVECDPSLVDLLARVASNTMKELGGGGDASQNCGEGAAEPGCPVITVPRIVSGAGHDAMAMSHLTKVAMLFVRCKGGISHRPDEAVLDDDILAASAALLSLMRSQSAS